MQNSEQLQHNAKLIKSLQKQVEDQHQIIETYKHIQPSPDLSKGLAEFLNSNIGKFWHQIYEQIQSLKMCISQSQNLIMTFKEGDMLEQQSFEQQCIT